MGNTKITWADKVWNPVTGCSSIPISEGCENCYAKKMASRLRGRFGYDKHNPFGVTIHEDRIDEPLQWKQPSHIFVCSMGDIFHDDVPFGVIDDLVSVMIDCPQHTFMILTKRVKRLFEYHEYAILESTDWHGKDSNWEWPSNIWLGATLENQQRANERIPFLLSIPAHFHWLSCEPLLGPVDLKFIQSKYIQGKYLNVLKDLPQQTINFVVVGGETGRRTRYMNPMWARDIRDDCWESNTAFFMKQMSRKKHIPDDLMIREWPLVITGIKEVLR